MMIRYCPHCDGRPYTRVFDLFTCPSCGTALQMENVAESSLAGRPELVPDSDRSSLPEGVRTETETTPEEITDGVTDEEETPPPVPQWRRPPVWSDLRTGEPVTRETGPIVRPTEGGSLAEQLHSGQTYTSNRRVEAALGRTIQGRVSQYSSTGREDGHYRRLGLVRLYDALIYGQRFEDVLHRFTVRVRGGTDAFGQQEYFDVPVNVHGTISGGVQLADNNEVEVTGTYRHGVLMARRVTVVSGGYRTQIRFQHSVGLIVFTVLALLAMILCIGVAADASNGGGLLTGIVGFLESWLAIAVILLVLYGMFCFSRFGIAWRVATGPRRRSPFLAILVVSLLLTVLIVSEYGPIVTSVLAVSLGGMS